MEGNALLTLAVDGEEKMATATGKVLAAQLGGNQAAKFEQQWEQNRVEKRCKRVDGIPRRNDEML